MNTTQAQAAKGSWPKAARRCAACCFALACALLGLPAQAVVKPSHQDELHSKTLAPAGFVATVAPQELSEVRAEVEPALLDAVAAFQDEAGPHWKFYVDRRSGGMALVEGQGLAWIPGAGNGLDPALVHGSGADGSFTGSDLKALALDFISRYPALFAVETSQLVFDESATLNWGESKQYWQVVFFQQIGGVPVEGSRIVYRLSHGNLVQFGVDRTVPSRVVPPDGSAQLSRAQAKDRLVSHMGGLRQGDRFFKDGELKWVARGAADQVGYSGPVGSGWEPSLVYEFTFKRDGEISSWRALVDAHDGKLVRLVDANEYASLVKASVYTVSNCLDPLNCVAGSALEVPVTMPFAALNFIGGLCSGDACYSNSAGAFAYPPTAVAATTSLEGKYFRTVDSCGAVSAGAAAPNNIDLGTSLPNPPANTNYDCQPATQESPPGTGPASGGSGDTHAARNTFYHLNLINQKARAYLPHNDWLRGVDGASGSVPVLINGPPACNAFWDGNGGSLVFLRLTPGLSCNNLGEIPGIFLHEFGHGLDQNDASGTAPEQSTGEAMGDSFALLQAQKSCIGIGALIPAAGNNWGHYAGYGTGSATCTGFRDLDYTRYCYHTAAAGCGPSIDPDAPNGSRSGPNPNLNGPDAGTPARWNHMIQGSPTGVANGQSNFYNCGGPEAATDCAGPLNHGCHCESMIASQANWDLAKAIVASRFGGNVYAQPPGPEEVSGWQYMDRLWYLTRDLALSAYSVPGPGTNGCGANNWFSTYRFIDDDNGNLADGTPHADLIFGALNLHAIACGQSSDPSNQASGCPPPSDAPLALICGDDTPVQLEWTSSPGASSYRILRNTLGCEHGFTPIKTASGGQRYYEDTEVAPGNTYYYSVQPVGSSASCYGQTSNCVAVSPDECSGTPPLPPAGVGASPAGDNRVLVSWNGGPGAFSYKISRKPGNCAAPGPFVALGVARFPDTSFLDDLDVQGTLTYSYQVASSAAACASCTSAPSACVSVQPTGTCTIKPQFDGAQDVDSEPSGQCALTVQWAEGSATCGSSVSYSVYRSTDPLFIPTAANLVAAGLTGTSFSDYSVSGSVRYFYIVHAKDSVGNEDENMARRSGIASAPEEPGTFTDDAGDTDVAKFAAAPTPNNTWAVRPSGTGNPTRQYATTASGSYADVRCLSLESTTITLLGNPTLSFRSRYEIEEGWDGGIVEVSTEAGGFTDWTKLSTVNYPGVMVSVSETGCSNPGLGDGQMVFTGSSAGAWDNFSGSLAAFANQSIRLRFLFGSDDLTNLEGWFIDDITITDAMVPGPCLGEVSRRGSGHPLRITKRTDGNLDLHFEDLGGVANAYNVYEGSIGTWYNHESQICHDTTTVSGVPGPGDRTLLDYSPGAGSAYILVNAVDEDTEGILGMDSRGSVHPMPAQTCGPN